MAGKERRTLLFSRYRTDSVLSPVTDLTNNLVGLSTGTGMIGTPKRRISWSSIGTPTPPCYLFDKENASSGSGNGNNTPTSYDVSSGSSFRRFKSMPSRLSYSPAVDYQENSESEGNVHQRTSPNKVRTIQESSLDIFDANSCDSGFAGDKDDALRIAEPQGLSPSSILKLRHDSRSALSSISSENENDDEMDGFMDFFDMGMDEEDTQLPTGFSELLTRPLPSVQTVVTAEDGLPGSLTLQSPSPVQYPKQSVLSEIDTNIVDSENKQGCMRVLFRSPSDPIRSGGLVKFQRDSGDRKYLFKRLISPQLCGTPVLAQHKRRRCCHQTDTCNDCGNAENDDTVPDVSSSNPPVFQRSHSESEASIMRALQKSSQDANLVGDFSRDHTLPLISGKHQDLKCVSPQILAQVIRGEYSGCIKKCVIVDCRYPYEYDGGHIHGAENLYTQELVESYLLETATHADSVLIFHCEFSSERGPKLSRYLRKRDREIHQELYPKLSYPEIYLLEGGYKAFYESCKELCEPQSYKPMNHKDHDADLRSFRSKSRSWNVEGPKIRTRPGLKF